MYTCVPVCGYVHVWEQVLTETRRQGQISWSWSCRQLWPAWRECWGLKSGPLQEQYVLLVRPSLQLGAELLSNEYTLNVTTDSTYANTAAQG